LKFSTVSTNYSQGTTGELGELGKFHWETDGPNPNGKNIHWETDGRNPNGKNFIGKLMGETPMVKISLRN